MIRQHAIDRALERYGLKLSPDDMIDLCRQCMEGYGRLTYLEDGAERHLVSAHGVALVVIYAPPSITSPKYGKIITVLPPAEATNKSNRSKIKLQRLPLKGEQKPIKKRKHWKRGY